MRLKETFFDGWTNSPNPYTASVLRYAIRCRFTVISAAIDYTRTLDFSLKSVLRLVPSRHQLALDALPRPLQYLPTKPRHTPQLLQRFDPLTAIVLEAFNNVPCLLWPKPMEALYQADIE